MALLQMGNGNIAVKASKEQQRLQQPPKSLLERCPRCRKRLLQLNQNRFHHLWWLLPGAAVN
ncbi:hypothetical protein DCM91_08670 [Chitinophaga costaii]|nr:hypothetical protein DCM91_08670 [Chitinophaga costaii]